MILANVGKQMHYGYNIKISKLHRSDLRKRKCGVNWYKVSRGGL